MTAESTQNFDALEMQAQRLVAAFTAVGAEYIAPAIIQPAGLFLDVVGESLRARTYVFNDPDGRELCLRPDLTVPACRVYLERDPSASSVARFCYNGPAFRYQAVDAPKANPREFRQAGIECFGLGDRAAADVEILLAVCRAVGAAGLTDTTIRIGDLGLFQALLGAVEMPSRWRRRLAHQFWRPDIFRAELKRLVTEPATTAQGIDPALLARIDPSDPVQAEREVAAYIESGEGELIGTRSITEITAGLMDAAADLKAGPLKGATADLIQSFVGIAGTPRQSLDAMTKLARGGGVAIDAALAETSRRLDLMEAAGLDIGAGRFAADFGRTFEYYTGFVFELVSPKLGNRSPVAGGGRYDGLLKAVGAPRDVPAVGAAIYTERVLAALGGQS